MHMADETRGDDKDFTMMRPHSAPPGRSSDERVKADAENVGEGAGSFLGGVTGAAFGIAGGPVGLVIGAIAGAVGGWWAGHGVADAFTDRDQEAYRAHYDSSPDRIADRTYDQVTPAYAAGHLAGRNPEYANRPWEEIEADLQRGWTDDVAKRHGQWPAVRPYARAAFDRVRSGSTPSE
jgi:hypothetical protein